MHTLSIAKRLASLLLCLSAFITTQAQHIGSDSLINTDTVPDGIFFRISGGDLAEPSYILGTLHTIPGDYVHHIPHFNEAVASVRQFIFEGDLMQKMRQDFAFTQFDSVTNAFIKARQDSLYRYDNPDSLHNPYIEDMEPGLYKLVRSTMADTFGLPEFYKYTVFENMERLQKRLSVLIKETVAQQGFPLQSTLPLDLFIADSIARPRGADILELDTTSVLNLDSFLIQFVADEKAGKYDRKYYSTTFLPNGVFMNWLLLYATQRYCASYFRHEARKLIEENNGQLEQKIFVERNAQWMRRLPVMLHRAPSMVVVGLLHLHDRSTTPGLLSSLKTLGYTIEALASPTTHRP